MEIICFMRVAKREGSTDEINNMNHQGGREWNAFISNMLFMTCDKKNNNKTAKEYKYKYYLDWNIIN